MSIKHSFVPASIASAVAVLALAACGGPAGPTPVADVTPAERPADATTTAPDPAVGLETWEADLARREADLALKEREQELARREAELAARTKAAAAPAPVKRSSTPPKPATVAARPAPPAAAVAPAPARPIVVPAGTQISIGLSSDVSTKTATIGDSVDARLASDLVIDGRRAILAGAPVRGRVTDVVSGSKRIGGTPTLAMNFDGIELEDGTTVPIRGQLVQQAKSDTGRDTAKIVGGTAAGAIIGHQIDDDKGKVIGGILGGAAGAIAARKTGGEIDVPAGTVMAFVLDAPFEVRPN
jgi:Glycine zipper 2TM domain